LGLPSDAFLLVTIGTAKNGQAVTEALAALAALPRSVHIAFVGAGYEQYLGIIEKYGLKDRAHPVLPVRPDEVVSFIRSADVALILYYSLDVNYENCLPNKFFQSVSAHLPLLYPELPEIRKISEEYNLGFPINPLSIESIKTGVNKFLQNPGRLKEYKGNSQRASQMLSWEQEEEILQNIVYKVLKPQL
jgi:glycosyltransferase involved in cell wall biosynthesis